MTENLFDTVRENGRQTGLADNGNHTDQLETAQAARPASDNENLRRAFHQAAGEQLAAMRPTLAITLGGTGLRAAIYLKAYLTQRFGLPLPRKLRLMNFDTARDPFSITLAEQTIHLEEGSEWHILSDVPVGSIIKNLDHHPAIRDRLGEVIHNLPARVLREGAKSNRPLGLLSLFWHFPTVIDELEKAIWHLVGRDNAVDGARSLQGINVFIVGGTGGGSGSPLLIEVAYLVRSLCDDLGIQSEFCHITGVGVLPQAYVGIHNPAIYPNAGAFLKELNHAMTRGNFHSRYPGNRTVTIREAPFDIFYVLDGVSERGQTWAGLEQVTAACAQAVFLQMVSQLGRSGDNAFDNLDSALAGQTDDGYGTFLGSIGQGYLAFPAPAVAELCARWYVTERIAGWLAASGQEAATSTQFQLAALAPAELAPVLLRDPDSGAEMHLEFRLPAGLLERRHQEVPSTASAYFRQFSHARLSEGLVGRLMANAASASRDAAAGWREWAHATLFAGSLPNALTGVRAARETLHALGEDGRVRLAQQDQLIERREAAVAGAEAALVAAAGSLLIGRDRRIRVALDAFTNAAQALLDARRQHGLIRGQLAVWGDVDAELEALDRLIDELSGRLAVIARHLDADTTEDMRRLSAGDATTISLADESYVCTLYRRFCSPDLAFMSLTAFDRPAASIRPIDLAALNTSDLTRALVVAVIDLFAPVARLTVDEVVDERAAEVSPRARRQQLFDRATPSWNIDRTRLPDGGNGLVRLEILGVPDSRHTSFSEEPMLVSTGDPHRITALVIVAGAPATALQQFDRYQTALARARCPAHPRPGQPAASVAIVSGDDRFSDDSPVIVDVLEAISRPRLRRELAEAGWALDRLDELGLLVLVDTAAGEPDVRAAVGCVRQAARVRLGIGVGVLLVALCPEPGGDVLDRLRPLLADPVFDRGAVVLGRVRLDGLRLESDAALTAAAGALVHTLVVTPLRDAPNNTLVTLPDDWEGAPSFTEVEGRGTDRRPALSMGIARWTWAATTTRAALAHHWVVAALDAWLAGGVDPPALVAQALGWLEQRDAAPEALAALITELLPAAAIPTWQAPQPWAVRSALDRLRSPQDAEVTGEAGETLAGRVTEWAALLWAECRDTLDRIPAGSLTRAATWVATLQAQSAALAERAATRQEREGATAIELAHQAAELDATLDSLLAGWPVGEPLAWLRFLWRPWRWPRLALTYAALPLECFYGTHPHRCLVSDAGVGRQPGQRLQQPELPGAAAMRREHHIAHEPCKRLILADGRRHRFDLVLDNKHLLRAPLDPVIGQPELRREGLPDAPRPAKHVVGQGQRGMPRPLAKRRRRHEAQGHVWGRG